MLAGNLARTAAATSAPPNFDVNRLGHWLLRSGIQRLDGPDMGAVYAWIDRARGRGSYLYSEITGYFMTLACHLARATGDSVWLTRAALAGDWIINCAMLDSGAVLTRKHLRDDASHPDEFCFQRELVVFFDCAMVGYGLLTLHRATADEKYLHAADAVGRFCLAHFLSQQAGSPRPIFDAKNQVFRPEEDRWSLHWGSFNLKSAMFFTELAHLTGDGRYGAVVDGLLPRALQAQNENGRFGTTKTGSNTHLHPHNYTTEGLLYLAWKRARPDLLARAKSAIDFAFGFCLNPERGMVHAWPDPDYCAVRLRSDVVAQSLRCYYIVKQLDPDCRWPWEEYVPLLRQCMDEFMFDDGGTSYGFDNDRRLLPHANAWCHFFNMEMRLHQHYAAHSGDVFSRDLLIT